MKPPYLRPILRVRKVYHRHWLVPIFSLFQRAGKISLASLRSIKNSQSKGIILLKTIGAARVWLLSFNVQTNCQGKILILIHYALEPGSTEILNFYQTPQVPSKSKVAWVRNCTLSSKYWTTSQLHFTFLLLHTLESIVNPYWLLYIPFPSLLKKELEG